jgi:type I restriction enzyme M protein
MKAKAVSKIILSAYLNGYTDNIKIIIDRSGIRSHINKLAEEKILYTLIKDFSEIDLSPEKVSNIKMGYVFEELVRKFSEANNAEAGEHYTPREVIDLMTHMLDMDEKAIKDGQLVTIYDPACGSGGMLSAAKEFIEEKINQECQSSAVWAGSKRQNLGSSTGRPIIER